MNLCRMRFLLAAFAALSAARPAPAVAQSVVAGPTTAQIATKVGDRITVPVKVDMTAASGHLLGAYRVRLSWDAAVLKLVSTASGSFAAAVFNTDSSAQGVVRFTGANANGVGGIVTLGSVTLEVLTTASSSPLTASFAELAAARTFTNLLPFLTVTSATFCPGLYIGDLDKNSLIQARDAQIVAMHAVGLAVADTSGGDTDGDGKVNTRDALIILSHVVGLDVSAFRVNNFEGGGCAVRVPASVAIARDTVGLASGDVLPLAAEVRDSAGGVVGGINLVWTSDNTGIVKVDSTGAVTAVAIGSTKVRVAALPGVTDSAVVTVGERHRWVVNPVVAQNNSGEVGSDAYPFSTIKQAVDRAAAGDTVFIHVARYSEAIATGKRLVFEGDSGAAGMPVITAPGQPAIKIDLAGGRQVIRRLRIEEAERGVVITGADTIALASLVMRALRGPGVSVPKAKAVGIASVTVEGARLGGILVDSAGIVGIAGAVVSGIEEGFDSTVSAESFAVGIRARAGTLIVDTSVVRGVEGGGIAALDASLLLVRRTRLEGMEEGITADSSTRRVVVESVRARLVDAVIDVERVDTLRVTGLVADSVGLAVGAWRVGFVGMTGGVISRAGDGVWADSGGAVAVSGTVYQAIRGGANWVGGMDSVRLDTITVNGARTAVVFSGTKLARLQRSVFRNVFTGTTTFNDSTMEPSYWVLGGNLIEDATRGFVVAGDSALITDNTIRRVAWYGVWVPFFTSADSTTRRAEWVRIAGGRIADAGTFGILADSALRLEVARVRVDSTWRSSPGTLAGAIHTLRVAGVRVDSSSLKDNFADGINVRGAGLFTARQDTIVRSHFGIDDPNGLNDRSAIYLEDVDSADVRLGSFTDNGGAGVYFRYSGAVDGVGIVEDNSFRGRYWGVRAWGVDTLQGHLRVRNNAFVGDLSGPGTRAIGMGPLRAMIVENNTVDSTITIRGAIAVDQGDTVLVRNNTVRAALGTGGIYAALGRVAVIETNAVSCADSNQAFGIQYHDGSGAVIGNTVSKCYYGGYSFNGLPWNVFDLTVRGNSFARDGAVLPPVTGYWVSGGSYRAAVVGNTVTGGAYSFGGIGVLGSSTYRNPRVRVDSNTVHTGAGRAIDLAWLDTLRADSNTVTRIDSLGVTGEAGIWVRDVWTGGAVTRNRITANWVPGIRTSGTMIGLAIDTNLIADNTNAGISLHATAQGRMNAIRRNGVGIIDSVGTGAVFRSNDIEGNAFGVRNLSGTVLSADSSWWGSSLGPRCPSGCDPSSTGDTISTNVSFAGFATASITGVPAGAPPAVARAAADESAVWRPWSMVLSGGATDPLPEPVAGSGGGAPVAGAGTAARAAGAAALPVDYDALIRTLPRRPERRR